MTGAGYPRDSLAGGTRTGSRKEEGVGNSSRCMSMFRAICGNDGVHSMVMEGMNGAGLPPGEGEDLADAFMVAAGGVASSISGLDRTRMRTRRHHHLRHSRCSRLRSTRSMAMVTTYHQNLNRMRPFPPSHSRGYRSSRPLIL